MQGAPHLPKYCLPAELQKLPAFPPIAVRVLNLLADDQMAVRELVELFRADPAFSAEVLRLANSAVLGLRSRISSLQHAIVVVGFLRIKELALTVATRKFVKDVLAISEVHDLWRYSVACALLSEELAWAFGLHVDAAYTAGLLHDLGRLGLMAAFSDQYPNMLAEANQKLNKGESFDLRDEERHVFGVDHYEAGLLLAEHWNLPDELRSVVGHLPKTDTLQGSQLTLSGLVQIAAELASAMGLGPLQNPAGPTVAAILERLDPMVRYRLPADPESLREEVISKVDELEKPGGNMPSLLSSHLRRSPTGRIQLGEPTGLRTKDTVRFVLFTAGFIALILSLLFLFGPRAVTDYWTRYLHFR